MPVVDKLEVDLSADLSNLKQDFKEAELIARDTGKQLDKDLLIKLEVDTAELKLLKDTARKSLREAKAQFDEGLISREKVTEAQRAFDRLSSQTTEANRRLQNYRNTGDATLSRLQAKFNGVTDEIKKSRDELIKLGKSTKDIDKLSTRFDNLGKDLRDGKITLSQYTKEVKDLQSQLKKGDKEFGNIETSLGGFTKSLGAAASVIAGIAGTVAFVNDLDTAFRKLEGQVGPTNERLDELKDTLVAIDNTGFLTLQESTKLVSTLAKETNLANKELKDTAIGVATISNIFDKDFNEVLRASTALQKNYGLGGQEANDLITKSLQATGDTYDDVLDSINEYAAKTSDAGVAVNDFINILLDGTKRGIRNTDELADVQREFAIRVVDGSKKSREALDKLGISYQDLEKNIGDGSITISDAQKLIATELQNVENEVVRNQLATDLLGTRYEDNGEVILEVLSDVQDELGEVEGATQELVTASQTGIQKLNVAWNIFTNNLKEKLIPTIDELSGKLGDILNPQAVQDRESSRTALINSLNAGVDARLNTIAKLEEANKGLIKSDSETAKNQIQINQKRIQANKLFLDATEGTFTLSAEQRQAIQKQGINLIKQAEAEEKRLGITTKQVAQETKAVTKETKEFNEVIVQTDESTKKLTSTRAKATKAVKEEETQQEKFAKTLIKLEDNKQKKYKETLGVVEDTYEDSGEIIDKAIKKSEKSIESFDKGISKLKAEISDLDTELSELGTSKAETLGERNIEILERQKEIEEEIQELRNSKTRTDESVQQRIDLQKESLALTEEQSLIQSNATTKELEEAKRLNELSPTARFIEENEKARAEIIKTRTEKEKDIEALETQKASEQDILDKFNTARENLDIQYKEKRDALEEKITDKVIEETSKRIAELQKFEDKVKSLASSLSTRSEEHTSELQSRL